MKMSSAIILHGTFRVTFHSYILNKIEIYLLDKCYRHSQKTMEYALQDITFEEGIYHKH